MRYAAVAIAALLLLLGYTKYVWQTGFDQGADVSQCLIASMIESGGKRPDMTDGGCQRAKAGERNLLWLLRRRNGG